MKKILFVLCLILSSACIGQYIQPAPMPKNMPGIVTPGNLDPGIFGGDNLLRFDGNTEGLNLFTQPDCGTPVPYETKSSWETVDTLGDYYKSIKYRSPGSYRQIEGIRWVYDEVKIDWSPITYLVNRPPCYGSSTTYIQFRICKITGIRQKQTTVKGTRYEPKPKSEYEQTVDKFLTKEKTYQRLPLSN